MRVHWEQGEDLGVENQHRCWVLEAKKESKGDLHRMSRWGAQSGGWDGALSCLAMLAWVKGCS